MLRRALTLLAFLAIASTTYANDAADIMRRAVQAMRDSDAIRVEIIASQGEDLRTSPLVIRGSLIADIDPKVGATAYRLDARVSGDNVPRGTRYLVTSDGDTAQLISYADKTERRVPAEEAAASSDFTMPMLLMSWVDTLVMPGEDIEQAVDLTAVTTRTERIGRHECDVIEYDAGEEAVTLYIARDTNLPARIDVAQSDQPEIVMIFKGMRDNVKASSRTFELRNPPRGFSTAGSSTASSGTAKPNATPSTAKVGTKEGARAPEWTLEDKDGKAHSLSDYLGEVVLIDFWATWCPPCRRAMPGLQKLHEKYAKDGLNVIGINAREESPDMAVGYMRSNRFDYQLLLEGDSVFDRYGCKGLPTFFLIDQSGEILFTASGFSTRIEHKLEEMIVEALGVEKKTVDPDEADEDDLEDFEDY